MDADQRTIYLPDTMINWPWPRAINPHFDDVKVEVDAWFRNFNVLKPESQKAFDKCDFGRLVALACPNVPREHLWIACGMMDIYFLFDDNADFASEAVMKEMVDIILDALHNPHKMRPEGEYILGEIVRQFWARATQSASLSSQRRFLETFAAYLHAVVAEVIDHAQGHKRSIDDYLKLRRYTIGLKPCFLINEMGMDLPDEVFYHPVIMDLAECITDLVMIDNDILSYNKEQAAGCENHNIVGIVMSELGLDVSGAMAWAAHYHAEVQKKYMDGLTKVPSWGPSIDVLVKEYLDLNVMWVRGNHSWHYESPRYFGTKGPEVQKTRLVQLLPKANRKAGV
ncbi:terpenoid synthase [Suillus decipiens]|nr:terpenoid synthase [Suillus decipiens]